VSFPSTNRGGNTSNRITDSLKTISCHHACSFNLKMYQTHLRRCSTPDPAGGVYNASSDPLIGEGPLPIRLSIHLESRPRQPSGPRC